MGNATALELVEDAARASKLLTDGEIPQLKVLDHQAKGDYPYLIVEKKPADFETFKFDQFKRTPDGEVIKPAGWTDAHEKAAVELYDKMVTKGIVAEDLHIENIYFQKNPDGSLTAGVLDHDYIGKLGQLDQKLADRFATIAFRPNAYGSNLESWLGRPLANRAFPDDARFYMGKMLEHKRWIIYDVESGTFKANILDPKWVREKFTIDNWVYRVPKPQSRLLPFVWPWPQLVARAVDGLARQRPSQSLACAV